MVKKQYTKENHTHWEIYGLIWFFYFVMIGFVIWQGIRINELEDNMEFLNSSEVFNCKFKIGDVVREDSNWGNRFDGGIITEVYHFDYTDECSYSIQSFSSFLLSDSQLTNHTMYPHNLDIDEENPTWRIGDWIIIRDALEV